MKKIQKLINEPLAKSAATFMMCICYIMILLSIGGMILSCMGRQTFILHTDINVYDSAIYSEENRDWTSRGPTISLHDEIRVFADGEKIDLLTQVGLSVIYAAGIVPLIISFWFLSRMFRNVSEGRIFIAQNASCLLYYGLIRIAIAVIVPFIKIFISYIANQFTMSEITVSTGQNIVNDLIPNIAFIVAAYIIHYGVQLQDEADHTL